MCQIPEPEEKHDNMTVCVRVCEAGEGIPALIKPPGSHRITS